MKPQHATHSADLSATQLLAPRIQSGSTICHLLQPTFNNSGRRTPRAPLGWTAACNHMQSASAHRGTHTNCTTNIVCYKLCMLPAARAAAHTHPMNVSAMVAYTIRFLLDMFMLITGLDKSSFHRQQDRLIAQTS